MKEFSTVVLPFTLSPVIHERELYSHIWLVMSSPLVLLALSEWWAVSTRMERKGFSMEKHTRCCLGEHDSHNKRGGCGEGRPKERWCPVVKENQDLEPENLFSPSSVSSFCVSWWDRLGPGIFCCSACTWTSVQFSSVAQSSPTLCDPMNRSTPGLPVHHHLPEFTQTHDNRLSDAHPAISSSVVPFSSCPQSFPASESFPMSRRWHIWVYSCIGEGNGNPLQCSCLENPRDGAACWAAIYGVAQSRTRLKRLSSSSITLIIYTFFFLWSHYQEWCTPVLSLFLPTKTPWSTYWCYPHFTESKLCQRLLVVSQHLFSPYPSNFSWELGHHNKCSNSQLPLQLEWSCDKAVANELKAGVSHLTFKRYL